MFITRTYGVDKITGMPHTPLIVGKRGKTKYMEKIT